MWQKLSESLSHLFHPRTSNNHRPRVLHPESYLFFVMIAVAIFIGIRSIGYWGSSFEGVLGFASSITAGQVIDQTNQKRAELGLAPLVSNPKLNQAALAKAQDMFSHQYWSHISPQGREPWDFIKEANYSYRVAGENLARDFSDTHSMVQAWMDSPTHRDNIVNSKYTQIGIAVVDGELLGYETTLVVQMFGTPAVAEAQLPVVKEPQVVVVEEEEPSEVVEEQPVVAQQVAVAPVKGEETVVQYLPELKRAPLFSPLQLIKAFFLALIILIVSTLVYDTVIISNGNVVRLVGKNIAHVMLFMAVAFLLIFFKGGVVG